MPKKTNIFSILDDSGDSSKANVNTLKAIVEEYNGLPSTLYLDDDVNKGWDYDKIAKIAFLLARQSDPNVDEEDIRSKITHHNIYQIWEYINKALTMEIPAELQQLILDNIELSKLDVMRRNLTPAQVNEIVAFVKSKGWMTDKDFENTVDEPKDAKPKN
jgi:hypothetical protein